MGRRPDAGKLALAVGLIAIAGWGHLVAGKRALTDWSALIGIFTDKTPYGCPKDVLFRHPWVKENVAVTYGLQIRDGLGSQTARMLGVYAIAQALGIHYVHSPFQCIGHIGGAPHYRNMRCDHLPPTDMQRLRRISQHIHLPSTTAADVSDWDSVSIFRGNWVSLARAAAEAFASKRPTLIKLELVDEFISACPDIFYHVDAWRPRMLPDTRVVLNTTTEPGGSWLLTASRSCRIVVHMRRGDLAVASAKRELPTNYYINVVKNLIELLDSVNQDYSVEWFTEPAANPKEHEDLLRIRTEVPNLTILYDSDLLWSWHQMWTSDIFIMSKSGYSFVPAVVNADAIIIHAPALGIRKCKIACSPSHWFDPANANGTLSNQLAEAVLRRAGSGFAETHD